MSERDRHKIAIYSAAKNYDYTINRIVNDGFRLSLEVVSLYELYYSYIMKKKARSRTDAKYIMLYNSTLKALIHKERNDANEFMEGSEL